MEPLHLEVLTLLLFSSLCRGQEEIKNTFSVSSSTISRSNGRQDLQTLLNKIAELEANLESLKAIQEKNFAQLKSIYLNSKMGPEAKSEFVRSIAIRSIEEDVQQNKEDIIDLRVNDGRHDMLISQGMLQTNYINNTIIPDLEFRVEKKIKELIEVDAYVDSTRPPIGSIIAWLPAYSAKVDVPLGWKRCDGSVIETGPLAGLATPDLNSAKRFLRGAGDENAGTVEDDMVQEHLHADPGHTHTDNGHTHVDNGHSHYEDTDHFPLFVGSDEAHHKDVVCTRYYNNDLFGGDCGGYFTKFNAWTTEAGRANIATAKAAIQTSATGIRGIASGRVGEETRPKNMNVVYIIRIL